MKDWQLKLLDNKNVNVDKFIEKYESDKVSKMDEATFKYCLEFYTKFSHNEQCDIWMNEVFEGVYDLDIPNADYLSHHLIYDDGSYYLFENKCGRASFTVYRIDESGIVEYDEKKDKCTFINHKGVWDKIQYVFSIRLKNIEFIQEFLENLLGRNFNFTKKYKRGLKIEQLLK